MANRAADLKNIWRSTHYEESNTGDSPKISYQNQHWSLTRVYLFDWNDRFWAIRDFVGFSSIFGNEIRRQNPHQDTLYPYCSATGAEYVGWAPRGKTDLGDAKYEFGKLTVMYESVDWDIVDDELMPKDINGFIDESSLKRNVIIQGGPAAEWLSIEGGTFRWAQGSLATQPFRGRPGKVLPSADISVKWIDVPLRAVGTTIINPDATYAPIDFLLGKVNAETFAGSPPDSLLLLAAIITRHRNSTGNRCYDIEYRFKRKDTLHNRVFSPADKAYVYISVDGVLRLPPNTTTGVNLFDRGFMRDLFVMPTYPP